MRALAATALLLLAVHGHSGLPLTRADWYRRGR